MDKDYQQQDENPKGSKDTENEETIDSVNKECQECESDKKEESVISKQEFDNLKVEIDNLKQEKEQSIKKAEEYLNLAKRVQADFENYKKRNKNSLVKMYEDTLFEVINDFLPVLDNIERAIQTAEEENWPLPVVEGIKKIAKQFKDVLASKGIKEIECIGKKFDPNLHNAVMTVDKQEGQQDNVIVEVLQKGYIKDDKVVRYSMVKVAK